MHESHKPGENTISLVLLWFGSTGCAASVAFTAGSVNVLRVATMYLTAGQLEGGKGFAIGLPMLLADGCAIVGFVITIVALFLSVFHDKRPICSARHWIASVILALSAALMFSLRR
jgi:hypothetical protein